jgi:hypothetical protein
MPMIKSANRVLGTAALFRTLANEIGTVSVVTTLAAWAPHPCRVSLGERIMLLLWDILAGKTPRYRVADRLTTTGRRRSTVANSAARVHPSGGRRRSESLMVMIRSLHILPEAGSVTSLHQHERIVSLIRNPYDDVVEPVMQSYFTALAVPNGSPVNHPGLKAGVPAADC